MRSSGDPLPGRPARARCFRRLVAEPSRGREEIARDRERRTLPELPAPPTAMGGRFLARGSEGLRRRATGARRSKSKRTSGRPGMAAVARRGSRAGDRERELARPLGVESEWIAPARGSTAGDAQSRGMVGTRPRGPERRRWRWQGSSRPRSTLVWLPPHARSLHARPRWSQPAGATARGAIEGGGPAKGFLSASPGDGAASSMAGRAVTVVGARCSAESPTTRPENARSSRRGRRRGGRTGWPGYDRPDRTALRRKQGGPDQGRPTTGWWFRMDGRPRSGRVAAMSGTRTQQCLGRGACPRGRSTLVYHQATGIISAVGERLGCRRIDVH